MQPSESLALERTQLAWRRTALAQIVFSALTIKLVLIEQNQLILVVSLLAFLCSLASYGFSINKTHYKSAFWALFLNCVSILLLGLLAIIVIL